MLTVDAVTPNLSSESACSEGRLAANHANAQLSTGPRTEEGKAISSLNAVKTGLCGRALLLASEEEACAYREHVARFYEYWVPDNVEEHALVQSLADTQWRIESIPGLESALYAQARLKGTPVFQHPDPAIQCLLLDGQTEVAEAKAIKNLRLHERRLRRQFEQDKTELNQLRSERFKCERREREQEAERQRTEARREQARLRKERREGRQAQPSAETGAGPVLLDANGFEFSNAAEPDPTDAATHHQSSDGSKSV